VSITLDDYPEETTWDLQNENGVVIAQGSGYTGGIVSTDVCVATGCYEFTIYDEYGDGLCCDWGNGSYSVISSSGETLAEGATFADLETTTVCANTVAVQSISEKQILIYPNPASDIIQIQTSHGILEALMYDATGRIVLRDSNLGVKPNLNIKSLTEGVYQLQIATTHGTIHQTVIVNR
jgi:hypothetical protein